MSFFDTLIVAIDLGNSFHPLLIEKGAVILILAEKEKILQFTNKEIDITPS